MCISHFKKVEETLNYLNQDIDLGSQSICHLLMLSYEMRLHAVCVEMEKIIKVTLIAFIPATKFIFN